MGSKRARNLGMRCLLAAIAAVIGYGLPYSVEWLAHLELGINQERLIRLRPTQPNPKILIIRITKDTPTRLEDLSPKLLQKAGALDETLPRYLHAFLFRQLEKARPRLLICDMYFERSRRREDWPLIDYFDQEQGVPVVLLWTLQEVDNPLRFRPGNRHIFEYPAVVVEPVPERVTFASYAAFNPGGVVDGAVIRQKDPTNNRRALYLAAEAALRLEGLRAEDLKLDAGGGLLRAGPYVWPVGHDEEVHIRWTDRNSQFDSVEYSEALHLLSTAEGRERFRDRIVLLGDATGRDLERTTRGDIDGVECVAEILNTLLLPDRLTRLSEELNLLWCFLLALLVTLALSNLRPVSVVGGALGATAVILVPQASLRWGNLWIDTVAAALTVVSALLLAGGWEGLRSGELARRFTPRHVREGRTRRQSEVATVLFVDVKGSTPLVARLGADGAREVLGAFLRTLGELLHRHGGDVERTMGDGMLVVFRARDNEPAEAHTVRCARSLPPLWEAVKRLDATGADGNAIPLSVTVGFECGQITGERLNAIGHEEWALYGPTIHLAARLQSECGNRGARAVIGPIAAEVLGRTEQVILLGTAALKGFDGLTPLYTLAEWADE